MRHPNDKFAPSQIPLDAILRKRAVTELSSFPRTRIENDELVHAAVAFTVVSWDDHTSASFLLTRRPLHLNRHGGQYALPGGKIEAGETVQKAALRELSEEVGISLPEDRVLGLMDDYQTRSGFVITPVVVWAGQIETFDPDPNEVAFVYRIPLADLKSDAIPVLERSNDGKTEILSAPLQSLGHRVFAPTAAFIYQFREIVLFGRHTRVAHFDQPRFAWG